MSEPSEGHEPESREPGAGANDAFEAVQAANRALLSRLRESLCAGDPAIDPALIQGETLEEVEASFAAAQAMVQRIRQQMARSDATVPAGAPGRVPPRPLSAFDKIRSGLERAV